MAGVKDGMRRRKGEGREEREGKGGTEERGMEGREGGEKLEHGRRLAKATPAPLNVLVKSSKLRQNVVFVQ